MVKYNRIIMSKMHNGGLFMLTIREIKRAATLEEALQLNQKSSGRHAVDAPVQGQRGYSG